MNAQSLSQLGGMLQDIFKETGTQLSLSSFGGEETAFSVTYRGEEVTLYIRGKGEDTESKIRLVRYLISGSGKKEVAPREDSLKSILLGEGGEWEAFRYITKNNLSDGVCFAADVVCDKRADEAFKQIERCIEGKGDRAVRMDKSRIAVVRFSDDESPFEFAQFLFQLLYEELGIRASVGVGCEVNSFSKIAASYSQAVTTVKLSGIFHAKGEVHAYREYLLVTMLEDLPETRLKEYMMQFGITNMGEVFSDRDLAVTAEQFLENNLNLSQTSRTLFLHRNTLMYRLDKIKRLTGLDIKNFSDAVTFRVISIVYKLLK